MRRAERLEPLPDKRAFKFLLHAMNGTLRDAHGGNLLERFDAVSKVLFLKLFDERELERRAKTLPDFRVERDETSESVARRLERLWRRACAQFPSLARDRAARLGVPAAAVGRITALLQGLSLQRTAGDVKGLAYEELLRNTFDKNDHQQYFTPHEIVQFMVDLVDPSSDAVICDPACGTGGFLVEALKRTKGTARVIGAEVDERLARVAQMNLLMHGSDDGVVHHLAGAGSLARFEDVRRALRPASCSTILTNPPFGSDLLDRRALDGLTTGRSVNSRRRSVLFVERCLQLLRPDGTLAIVLDDSVLNLPGNADIRALIRAEAHLLAVVSLPDVAFMPYSTAKSSIVVLRKKSARRGRAGAVFMADVGEVGRRPNGDPLYSDRQDQHGNRLLQSDLPDVLAAYRRHGLGQREHDGRCFAVAPQDVRDRLDVFFHHPQRHVADRKLASCRWPTPPLGALVSPRRERANPARDSGDMPVRWIGLADIEEGTGDFDVRTVPGYKIRSAANLFRAGDILMSRLRPTLRKVVLIPDDDEGGVCSGEILVLQTREAGALDRQYLEFMLRSDLVYGQLLGFVTGVGRPRVSQDVVLNVRIPVPPLEEQQRIVARLSEARRGARDARRRASELLAEAQRPVAEAQEAVIAEMTTAARD